MNRNKYIIIGFIVMSFNSLYQYSWNALEPLLRSGFDVSLVQIALGFTLFSIFSSAFQPIGGHFADKYGPKMIGILSGVLSAIGFLGTYLSPNIYVFYAVWSIGSIGEGILYGIAANLAMKWFRDRMGFATGIVSMGFGLGSAIANPFIAMAADYKLVTLIIGLAEVILLPILLWLSDYPPKLAGQAPKQVILTAKFWLIYVSFVGAVVPLTTMSSELPILGKNLPQQELIALISILPLLSGGLRPFFGYIADRLGIVRTTLLLNVLITIGAAFLLVDLVPVSTVLIGFAGGSMITLYFNVAGEIFGTRFSTVNSGILYTGKALGGALGSVVFAILYTISLQLSEIYTVICGIIGVIGILSVIIMSPKQTRKVQ
ncbi:MFS transporter [Sulfolobus sp. A20-N-F6]|uniref:OFA family MFS transporter n=1 Tax=Saccharolobus sp. A20 TaxID=1891280 RepID=UPI0008460963|nr:OFA family MFS transporter [Sulfolobus sp. A20]TRM76092.1 MFS transporter [Sulfolobus sp. A20-N-F8]TRM76303.1 MFS transporter [Sulfolobus sp. E5]TRM77136.1 MFS transporter [Sulfolobus sp. B5]TRM80970.1 MFS transporter [Sulfolobus sp. D5]TRM84022.1 MFS transporter [Sulfolobus sp. A20-N-F6]TRM86102.1 MFS transporter [Sulfolobus sp. E3]TRM88567.1 MFS transporter [Sulfolobus sp. C3]TRM94799.1 MFS transporter [Sulfolobus sp. A20-N-G8]TRN02672.1 MFS transporter [Sulfolobus sp. F1]TRN03148.1 